MYKLTCVKLLREKFGWHEESSSLTDAHSLYSIIEGSHGGGGAYLELVWVTSVQSETN